MNWKKILKDPMVFLSISFMTIIAIFFCFFKLEKEEAPKNSPIRMAESKSSNPESFPKGFEENPSFEYAMGYMRMCELKKENLETMTQNFYKDFRYNFNEASYVKGLQAALEETIEEPAITNLQNFIDSEYQKLYLKAEEIWSKQFVAFVKQNPEAKFLIEGILAYETKPHGALQEILKDASLSSQPAQEINPDLQKDIHFEVNFMDESGELWQKNIQSYDEVHQTLKDWQKMIDWLQEKRLSRAENQSAEHEDILESFLMQLTQLQSDVVVNFMLRFPTLEKHILCSLRLVGEKKFDAPKEEKHLPSIAQKVDESHALSKDSDTLSFDKIEEKNLSDLIYESKEEEDDANFEHQRWVAFEDEEALTPAKPEAEGQQAESEVQE